MSHLHSQAGSWAGIPAGGKLSFVGKSKQTSKHYGAAVPLLFGGEKGGACLFDFRKLTSAMWLFFNA